MIVELIRVEESIEGTIGILKLNKELFCCTMEPPDFENTSNKASIPIQQYECVRVDSPKYGDTFEVTDVPYRSYVLFHSGNVVDHTKGCILLGSRPGKLRHANADKRAVLNSGETFRQFMKRMVGLDKFHLTIQTHY